MSEAGQAVFLSYASQDAEAAKRICEALRAAGVEVWFDQSELVGGDAWDQKIRKQIRECALVIPVISKTTQSRREAYFRLEWKLADERTHLMAKGTPFLLPVTIDETSDRDALVPDSFVAIQWTKAPGGEVPPAFAVRVKKLLAGSEGGASLLSRHSSAAADDDARGRAQGAPLQEPGRSAQRGPSRWWWALPIFGVTMALVLVLKEARKEQAPLSSPPAGKPAVPSVPQTEAQELTRKARALIDDDLMAVRENFRLADEFSRHAVALDATDGEAWATAARVSAFILRARYEMTPERKETAKTQVERAGRLAPDSIETGLALATYLEVNNDPGEAERLLRRLVQRAPTDKRLWRSLAANLANNDRNEEALATLRQPAGLLEEDPQAQSLLAYVLSNLGRYREEEAVLDRVLRRSPTKLAYYYQLVLEGFFRSDLAAASRILEKIPPQLMQEDSMINSAAEIWLRLGEGDKALQVLQKSPRDFLEEGFEVRPKGFLTGAALQLLGRPTAATAEWRQALVVVENRLAGNPNQPLLLYWRGVLQALTGQKAAALETRKLYRELEARPNAWFDAILLVAAGENEQAIQGLERAWPTAPVSRRVEIRGELEYGPWLTAIRADPRMQRLISELTAVIEHDRAGPTAAPTKADEKSVAVLAFANLSDDKANEYFSDGISEELLNVLAKISGLKVAARTSAFYFKGKEVPVPEIARQLGVAYVVEGSVRKAGDKVRITAQLIKAADGFHVWSETFTRDLKDIFAVQDEIAGLIAKNLELKMGMGEVVARQAVSPEAYQEYLLGRAAAAKASTADMLQAVKHFDRAVALEPKYTAAWVQLASAHTRIGRWGGAPTRQAWLAARAAIDRARALEPDSPEVLLALGWILRTGEWNWREAERAFRRALALQPNQPEIMAGTAVLLFNIGQTDEAFRLARQAIQLDPLNAGTQIDLSIMFCLSKNWDEAEKAARRALQLAPGGTAYHCILAWTLIVRQRYDEAEAEISQDKTEDGIDRYNSFGLLAVARGQNKVAREWLARLEEIARTNEDLADLQQNIAWLNTMLGEKDRAFAALEKAYTSRDPSMSWLLNSWWLEPLHSDPRWPALVRKVGLAEEQLK